MARLPEHIKPPAFQSLVYDSNGNKSQGGTDEDQAQLRPIDTAHTRRTRNVDDKLRSIHAASNEDLEQHMGITL